MWLRVWKSSLVWIVLLGGWEAAMWIVSYMEVRNDPHTVFYGKPIRSLTDQFYLTLYFAHFSYGCLSLPFVMFVGWAISRWFSASERREAGVPEESPLYLPNDGRGGDDGKS
jgi:hypothetical protein